MKIGLEETFRVFGIQHQNADIKVREAFSISEDKISAIYQQKDENSGGGMMILSTCNRTEIWTYHDNVEELKKLYLENCSGEAELFERHSFHLEGNEAIEHIFRVASGLDSQILGDLQIQSQIKKSAQLAHDFGSLNAELNRLIQISLKYSKRVKNETEISSGAASVAYAAVQYILEHSHDIKEQRILLYGTGKMGTLTCENLKKHIDTQKLCLINRTKDKALDLAKKIGGNVRVTDISQIVSELDKADIIIVATGSATPTVSLEEYKALKTKNRILIDLSVPRNIDPGISELELTKIADVDILSKMQEETIEKRQKAIPKANEILKEGRDEFAEWINLRHLSPTFKAIKHRLQEFKTAELEFHKNKMSEEDLNKLDLLTGRMMDRLARQMINHIKDNHQYSSDPVETLTSILEIKN